MKNKGFTLMELLGVMVLLSLVLALTIPSAINFIKSSNENKDELTETLIISASKTLIEKNLSDFPRYYGNTYCITLNELIEEKYLVDDINFSNEENLLESKVVKATYTTDFNYEIVDKQDCSQMAIDMLDGLTPVKYNGTDWIVADPIEQWYNYENQEWANAVILSSNVEKNIGDVVTVEGTNPDSLAMYVWIPRYEYKIEGEYGTHLDGTAGTQMNPGEIKVNFISTRQTKADEGYIIHPAFKFGSNDVLGIWVGKFETSHITLSSESSIDSQNLLSCNNEICSNSDGLRILPNVVSLGWNNLSNYFFAARSMSRAGNVFGLDSLSTNSHLIKNTEWAAIAYLSQSRYGKYGNDDYTGANKEIFQNKSTSFITGKSNGTPSTMTENTECNYNDITDRGSGQGSCGGGASTTGNITGVYDMVGGAWEYVMEFFKDSTNVIWIGESEKFNSGFSGILKSDNSEYFGSPFPKLQYYNLYNEVPGTLSQSVEQRDGSCNGEICYGHGLTENDRWYMDNNDLFIGDWCPFAMRGYNHTIAQAEYESNAGIFSVSCSFGDGNGHYGMRVVLLSENN